MQQREIEERNNGHAPGGPIREAIRNSTFPEMFMSAAATFVESLPRVVFRDENHVKEVMVYYAHLSMFKNMAEEIEALRCMLLASVSIDARGLKYGLQAHVGIYWPDEIKKEDKERLAKMQKTFKDRNDNEDPTGRANYNR